MIGTYVFRSQGKIVGTWENLLTTAGRREILRFLAGRRSNIGGSIGLGVGDREPALQDSDLMLEFVRLGIEVTSPDFLTNRILYKTTIPQAVVGNIYEVGLFTGNNTTYNLSHILSFDDTREAWSGTGISFTGDQARLDSRSLYIPLATNTNTTATTTDFFHDFSSIPLSDRFMFAFYVNDYNTASIRLRFVSDVATDYYQYTISEPTPGYNVVSFGLNDLARAGTGAIGVVRRLEILVTSNVTDEVPPTQTDAEGNVVPSEPLGYTGTRVYLDGLSYRLASARQDEDILVSRSVRTPIVKTDIAPMDVEYYLEMNTV